MSDEETVHKSAGAVPCVHFLLHKNSRLRACRGRHAGIFQSFATLRPPDGLDPGGKGLDRENAGTSTVDSTVASPGRPACLGLVNLQTLFLRQKLADEAAFILIFDSSK